MLASRRVTKTVKLLVVLIMLISVPVRGIAAATADFCGHQETLMHGEAAHEHGGEQHQHGPADGDHCSSASFATPAAPVALGALAGTERIASGDRVAECFVRDQLDPPPLAL